MGSRRADERPASSRFIMSTCTPVRRDNFRTRPRAQAHPLRQPQGIARHLKLLPRAADYGRGHIWFELAPSFVCFFRRASPGSTRFSPLAPPSSSHEGAPASHHPAAASCQLRRASEKAGRACRPRPRATRQRCVAFAYCLRPSTSWRAKGPLSCLDRYALTRAQPPFPRCPGHRHPPPLPIPRRDSHNT